MRTLARILLILLLIAAAAGGAYWFYQSRGAAAASNAAAFTQVVAVQRGDLDASLSVVGELDAVQQQDLGFERMAGTAVLLTLEVAPGNQVEAGQVLATIDSAPYQQALDQAHSAWQEATQSLADLRTPATELEIAQADLALAEAQLQLQAARQDLADLEAPDTSDLEQAVADAGVNLQLARMQQTLAEHDSLAKSERDLQYAADWHERRIWELRDLIDRAAANAEQTAESASQQETLAEVQADLGRIQAQRQVSLQAAAAAVSEAQAALSDAQEALAEAQAGGDALILAQARLAVREAEVAVAAAEEKRADLETGPDAVDLAAAQADVDKKQLALDEAEADLAATTLTAPFAGTVLQTNAEVGDRINANSLLLTLANMDELQVIAAVDETTIRQVDAGQPAQITFDAFPGQTFSGQVLSVPLDGTLQGGVTVYEVPISLQGAGDLPLLVGMTANVDIRVGQVQDALLVPAMALQNVGGFYQVLVENSSDPAAESQAVPVQIGLSDGIYTEIQRGLNEGDRVLVQLSANNASSLRFPGGGEGPNRGLIGIGGAGFGRP